MAKKEVKTPETKNEISPKTLATAFQSYEKKICAYQVQGKKAQIGIAGALYNMAKDEFLPIIKDAGYKNIAEYAEASYDIMKTQTYDCIKVFGVFGDERTLALKPAFIDYNFSQLKIIAPLYMDVEITPEVEDKIKTEFPWTDSVRKLIEKVKAAKAIEGSATEVSEETDESDSKEEPEGSKHETEKSEKIPSPAEMVELMRQLAEKNGYTVMLIMDEDRKSKGMEFSLEVYRK